MASQWYMESCQNFTDAWPEERFSNLAITAEFVGCTQQDENTIEYIYI